ncbi:hypothetical protein VAE130_600032 [Vibrio aestuarianus]|nr:conserved exported hypothetical protein [Vibrio aestuarianus subsp. francensis]CAH8219326.1 hypothetical protein VAE032_320033 [Vibrio aestuarianus]CAH8219468.1 hypothetical protein VAE128_500032 [Vibrio aestuarianus]CAH8219662.1 hypothetical protein VAE130_600032 [Vibrio aestuarianus]CAH8219779.1 hypothetical protein VAE115_370032 [Vibrio aestuarianus]
MIWVKRKSLKLKHNKRFKRDSQRVAFLLCVGFCGYGVMRKLSNGVGCPLTGRYAFREDIWKFRCIAQKARIALKGWSGYSILRVYITIELRSALTN